MNLNLSCFFLFVCVCARVCFLSFFGLSGGWFAREHQTPPPPPPKKKGTPIKEPCFSVFLCTLWWRRFQRISRTKIWQNFPKNPLLSWFLLSLPSFFSFFLSLFFLLVFLSFFLSSSFSSFFRSFSLLPSFASKRKKQKKKKSKNKRKKKKKTGQEEEEEEEAIINTKKERYDKVKPSKKVDHKVKTPQAK